MSERTRAIRAPASGRCSEKEGVDAMDIALALAGAALVAATALSFLPTGAWWARVFDFPRGQIATLLALVLALHVGLGEADGDGWALRVGVALALIVQLARIAPYTVFWRKDVHAARRRDPNARLRLLVANVLQKNRRPDGLLDQIRRLEPDVVLFLETDDWWRERLAPILDGYPHRIERPQDNTYGLIFASRLEMRNPELRFLCDPDVPSMRAELRLRDGTAVDFYGIHPLPPRPGQDTDERDTELARVAVEVAKRKRPAIVAGDLNDVAWSRTTRLFKKISALADPRVGRGQFSTFHARIPLLRWPLDHIFHDPNFALGDIFRLKYYGSDHFPILVDLYYEPREDARALAGADSRQERREAVEALSPQDSARLR